MMFINSQTNGSRLGKPVSGTHDAVHVVQGQGELCVNCLFVDGLFVDGLFVDGLCMDIRSEQRCEHSQINPRLGVFRM